MPQSLPGRPPVEGKRTGRSPQGDLPTSSNGLGCEPFKLGDAGSNPAGGTGVALASGSGPEMKNPDTS